MAVASPLSSGPPRGGAGPTWSSLLPEVDTEGPKVRLGVAWAMVSIAAAAAGPIPCALVFAAVAIGASGQVCRSWRGRRRTPYLPVAVSGAALCALAGAAGPEALGASALVVVVASVAADQLRLGRRRWDVALTASVALVVGLGAAAPSLARGGLGVAPALVLVATVHVVDASAFLINSGSRSRWEGWVAGGASAAALALATAALVVPPFRGASPWILAGLVAVLAPVGTMVATALVGLGRHPAPALRRLDSLIVAGPAWAAAAALLLER